MTSDYRNASSGTTTQEGVTGEIKHDAERIKDTVGARAKNEAESRKGQAAHVAGSASSALNSAADDLRNNPEAPEWMASALQQAARKIEDFSSRIEGRSIDQLGEDIAQFARRNPGTFLIASAAAGFAAARVLRAGADKKRHDHDGTSGMYDTQPSQAYGADQQGWAADENIRPTATGEFESAYLINDGSSNIGGTAR